MEYPVYEAEEVENPFEQPGLTEELLLGVLKVAQAQRAQATLLDAPTRGGTDAYHEAVVHLRRGLIPHDWTFSNAQNLCTVISPDKRHAIALAQGTKGTGILDRHPETKRALGPTKSRVLDVNLVQLELFGGPKKEVEEQPLTWFFLSFIENGKLYSELSLPDLMTEAGVVTRWRQRWVLTETDLNDVPVKKRNGGDNEASSSASDIVVPVALKR